MSIASITILMFIFAMASLNSSMGKTKALKSEMKLQEEQVKKLLESIQTENEKKLLLDKEHSKAKEDLEKASKADNSILSIAQDRFAYLTFDDGPSKNTAAILDFLKANNIKATFFVLGNGDETIYKRIVQEGHTLAPHSESHKYEEIYKSSEAFMKDLNSLATHLEEVTGIKPTITRIPGGSVNSVSKKYGGDNIMDEVRAAVTAAGYTYFDWNVDSNDASDEDQSKNSIVGNVLQGVNHLDEAVILLHDTNSKATTLEALPEIVEGLRKQGFSFRAITQETTPIQYK